ncbi:ribose ABC transporter permease [Limnochorda pilosa]|uniref:Ribose ABC transporter permease n=1 Tax=Limnochorda pilosa TaxID=1555112 RepID=A0A0K2SLF1_LIMPI|nr:ribose ABC transporter permease [Limnochorda pilosa]
MGRSGNLPAWLRSREAGVLLALVLLVLFFSVTTSTFLTSLNLLNVLRQVSVVGIITLAMTILIISQEFDLSVGSMYAVVGIVVATLFNGGMSIWMASLAGLALAAAMGLVNGVLTVRGGIPSFIVTLGMMMVYRGVALLISGGSPASVRLPAFFYSITGSRLWGAIPAPALWFVIMAVAAYFLLHVTGFGFKAFAVGGNREAARLAGINTGRVKVIGFILTATAAGLAATISLSYLGSATPTQGQGMELQAIAGAVIGGASLMGGVGSIVGGFMGAIIMGIVRNGLVLLGVSAYLQELILGLVVIVAVLIGHYSTQQRR